MQLCMACQVEKIVSLNRICTFMYQLFKKNSQRHTGSTTFERHCSSVHKWMETSYLNEELSPMTEIMEPSSIVTSCVPLLELDQVDDVILLAEIFSHDPLLYFYMKWKKNRKAMIPLHLVAEENCCLPLQCSLLFC